MTYDPSDPDDDAARAVQARLRRENLEGGQEYDADELRTLVELSTDMIAITGFDGHFGLLNGAWVTTLGWTRAELRGAPFIDFVHPDDREKTTSTATRIQGGVQLLAFQNRYRCKDGSYRPMSWKAIVSAERQRYYSVTRVATDALAAQERLNVVEALCEHSREAILVQSAAGVITDWTGAGERLFGHRAGDLVGEPTSGFLSSTVDGSDAIDLLGLARLAAGADRVSAGFRRADGAWIPVRIAVSAYGDGATAVTGAVATFSPGP